MSSILKAPAVRGLFGFSIVARLPLAMLSIGLVVHVQHLTGSFAAAGLATAAYALGEGIGGPTLGRLVDRGAQTLVLLASATVAATLLLALAIVPPATPVTLLVALAGGTGLATPPVAACLRSQLPALLEGGDRLQAGYALETSLAEVVWVGGPPLILGVGALWSTGAALAMCGLVLLTGTVGYAAQHASRDWRPAAVAELHRAGSLRSPMIRTLVLVLFCFGVLLGADEVAVSASAKALEGSTTAAAPLFALWGTGSFVGGLILARFGGGAGTVAGLVLWLVALTLGHLALIPAAGSVFALALILVMAGAAIAPTESSVYGMVDGAAPAGTATEAFAWLATAIAVGSALGAAGAGALADQAGPTAAYLLGGAGGALATLIAIAQNRPGRASQQLA
jgi:MFS family permease